MASTTEKRDIAFKHTLDVYHTRIDKQWFEETYGTKHVMTGPELWASSPDYNDAAAAVVAGLAVQEVDYVLTEDPFSDGRLWVAKSNPGVWPYDGPLTDYTQLNAERQQNWIAPVKFGPSSTTGYSYVLKQNDGSPIPDGDWEFHFGNGLLHLDDGNTATDNGWATPLKLTAYRYTGDFLTGGTGGASPTNVPFTAVAEVTVTHNLGRRPLVQVMEKAEGGIWGSDEGFGTGGFGTSDVYRIMEPVHNEVRHMSVNQFRVIMDNFYTGEIVYE